MYSAILLLPLFGALIAGFGWRLIGDKGAQWLTTGLLMLCALLSWIAFFTVDHAVSDRVVLFEWISSGSLTVDWAIRVDTLTCVMLVVVTSVSSLVHLYSQGYMAHDENFSEDESYRPRFFAYLSFFTFSMLALVTSDNLLQMFFGWEGVGVASYLLIGFYYRKDSANAAAIKAFVVNRVGDFGFALGIFGLYLMVDSIAFDDVFAAAPELAATSMGFLGMEINTVEILTLLLFVGAMGKSAQFFLHTWLPDAMEGPTPVSALIHAATMVTAGVFLVCRMSPLYEFAPGTLELITYVGATTALFAGSVGLVQTDIKRVIAYSTCSQLGYMFAAAGVGAYEAAMFHLFTHAFFKALLFLGAGSVIHAMHHEQDMTRMGGLKAKIPRTYWMMVIGTVAITGVGIPFLYIFGIPVGFAGFVSKEMVIWSTFASGTASGAYAYVVLSLAATMTAFYSWRLIVLTFHGTTRADKHTYEHAHESPTVMMIPLYVLAVGALIAGVAFYMSFIGHHENEFWGPSILNASREVGDSMLLAGKAIPKEWQFFPFACMLFGAFLAWVFYVRSPHLPSQFAARHKIIYDFLWNKWYFDQIYAVIFVRPAMWIGKKLWRKGDDGTIDGIIYGIAAGIVPWFTRLSGRVQSGYVFHYAFAMLIGLSALITWFAVRGGAN
jgi:NADH-quinone oxidoreductase subunit L